MGQKGQYSLDDLQVVAPVKTDGSGQYSLADIEPQGKPFSLLSTAGKTALKVGSAAVRPDIISGGTVNPDYSLYQQGLRYNLNTFKSPSDPTPQPTGFAAFLARHSGGTLKEDNGLPRKDYTPRTPQEQAEFHQVVNDMSAQNPGWAKNMMDSLKDLSPVVLNGQEWRSNPNEATSTSLANLILLRQGFKIPSQMRAAEIKTQPIPNVFEGEAPADIPQGKSGSMTGTINQAANTVANAKLPPGVNFIPKVMGLQKMAQMVAKVTAPKEGFPVYGNAVNAEIRQPYQPYQGDLSVTPSSQTAPAPRIPIRGGSKTIQTFTGSTPEEIAANNERIYANQQARLQARKQVAEPAPQAQEATPPASSQPSTLPRVKSGEMVLNQALTALDNQSLLKIARSRGIDVTREAQLKPGAANNTLVKKIIDDFSPDELDEVRNQGIEMSRHIPVQNPAITPEAAQEAWHYKVLNTFFPDVKLPKAMEARARATIANRPMSPREQAFYAQAAGQANAVPVDDLAQTVQPQSPVAGSAIEELLRQSLIRRGITPPK